MRIFGARDVAPLRGEADLIRELQLVQSFNWAKASIEQELQLDQANATLSSDLDPNFSDERATIRPPRAR
jgi:hypothetical protein